MSEPMSLRVHAQWSEPDIERVQAIGASHSSREIKVGERATFPERSYDVSEPTEKRDQGR
ncbi:hypothetical protein LCGC14_2339150 [marine sediment metagenome]|uniref:Uncharacterized protein n=1 Tax=marine sediment metagenome TaxID=412755 RepID=A0A0F9CDC7_9ZZZZ